ncbi:MAG: hypothetical protein ABEJ55_03680 [Halanaeroarchaeum sp.]
MTPSDTGTPEGSGTPIESLAAFVFAVPLATLVGAVLAPPDAFAQGLLMGLALLVGWPLSSRLVHPHRYGPSTLALFYVVILIVVVSGLWAIERTAVPPGTWTVVARVFVVGLGVVAGIVLVLSRATEEQPF